MEPDPNRRQLIVLFGTAAVLVVADQVTKAIVIGNVALGERIAVVGDLVQVWHVRNNGAAFSLFQGETLLFFVVSVVALVMIAYFHRTLRERSAWVQVLLGAVLGGTLGNLVDRLRFGYVTDFISVGLDGLRWPTFNIADSSIVVGIVMLVGYLTIADRHAREEARA